MRDAGSESMGNSEADHASPMGAQSNLPTAGNPSEGWGQAASPTSLPEERARQNTPLWMETPSLQPGIRRGAPPPPRSGVQTLLFFGLIVFVVAAAGIGGVALWGPEKTIKNRTQFATNPPAPMSLPTLAPVEPTSAVAPVAASVADATPAGATEPARVDEAPAPKKGKKSPKTWKKNR